jgi:tetratricopeptide (TPR) repeat protein
VFAIQSEIAKRIAESLQAKLTGREEQALAAKPTNDPEAYDAYLRGRAFEARSAYSNDALRKAIASYERAVRLDPNFGGAWARLSRADATLYFVRADQTAAYSTSPEGENLPVVTIHSAGNIPRGKTGSFVLDMKPALMFGGTNVNFKVSGTAIQGVDYVALVSPTYIGQSGYGTILVKTLPDPRGPFNRQAYSVVVTLEPGLGYALGIPSSATMWIKP